MTDRIAQKSQLLILLALRYIFSQCTYLFYMSTNEPAVLH